MRWIGKDAGKGFVQGVVQYFTAKYVLPIGAPIVTVAIGYASNLPWFWVWLGALGAFAFVSTGLLRFNEWIYERKVEHKLSLGSPRVVSNIRGEGMALGLSVRNDAKFPIEFQINELRTQISNKVPPVGQHSERKIIVPAQTNGWWDDDIIVFDVPRPGTVEGLIEFKLKYGLPTSSRRYELDGKKQVVISFKEDGTVDHSSWNEVT